MWLSNLINGWYLHMKSAVWPASNLWVCGSKGSEYIENCSSKRVKSGHNPIDPQFDIQRLGYFFTLFQSLNHAGLANLETHGKTVRYMRETRKILPETWNETHHLQVGNLGRFSSTFGHWKYWNLSIAILLIFDRWPALDIFLRVVWQHFCNTTGWLVTFIWTSLGHIFVNPLANWITSVWNQ
jgi:hypothetical protein